MNTKFFLNWRRLTAVLTALAVLLAALAPTTVVHADSGLVVAWGDNDYGQTDVPADLSGVIAIAGGDLHSLALKDDGTVVVWGDTSFGQGNVPADLSGVTAIAAGAGHNLALKADGLVVAWGDNTYGQTDVPAGLSGVTAIAAGGMHSLALKGDGTVVAWGDNTYGQTDVPAGLSGVIAIAGGYYHSLALKGDGTVVAWGWNVDGQTDVPADLSGVTAIAAGGLHSLALKADGTVVAWGHNTSGQTDVPAGLSGVTAIAAGANHSLALIPAGDVTVPVITTQPQSQAVYVGDAVSFNAAANGNPTPTIQWQVSTDGGATWSDIAGATASPFTFTASLDQNGNQYRAVFTNSLGSATSNAATLTVKIPATVTLSNLTQTYDGQPKPVTVTTDPAGLSVAVTYDGSPTAPTHAGNYAVVAMIDDAAYGGSATGTLTIQPKAASVTPDAASKVYGEADPALTGTLTGFVAADSVTAAYSRTTGEAVDVYTISAVLSPTNVLANYNITYNTATFTITPRPVTVTADAKSKVYGEADPALTYQITSGSLAFGDAFTGALTRESGEEVGVYAILQGTLALDNNYTLTYVGADFTIAAPPNTAPTADPGGPYLVTVNTDIQFDGSGSFDPEGDVLIYTWGFGDGETGSGVMPTHSYEAAGTYDVCLTVDDGSLTSEASCTTAVVYGLNTAPTADPGGPYLDAINTGIQFDGSGSSDPENDPLTYVWNFGDNSTLGTGVMPTHSYEAVGIYDVCLVVDDGSLNSDPACTLAVVYDPSGGFVTGGGWIDSPAGAYMADPTLSGKAAFGFVAKYQNGASAPTGNTEFQFQAGSFNFHSDSYEWLVVNQAGTNAQFKGSGTVNDTLDPNGEPYKFMLWAGDGASSGGSDTFRIKIWWEDTDGTEYVVYDNGSDQPIGGGSIVVHNSK